jgi:PLP dependent protein
MSAQIGLNLAAVRAQIASACAKTDRDPAGITLVAVSKTHPPSVMLAARQVGLNHFGENRIEEAAPKIAAVADSGIAWHMIGHVQSRKASAVIATGFSLIHSLDSLKLAERYHKLNLEAGGAPQPVLLEINLAGEASKDGLPAKGWADNSQVRADLWGTARQIMSLDGLHIAGLMTIAPITAESAEEARPIFAGLRNLRDSLQQDLGVALPFLSMGMSDDYAVAIEEGATHIRLGRALFGAR